jgi:hypothetical protein
MEVLLYTNKRYFLFFAVFPKTKKASSVLNKSNNVIKEKLPLAKQTFLSNCSGKKIIFSIEHVKGKRFLEKDKKLPLAKQKRLPNSSFNEDRRQSTIISSG